MRGNRRHAPRTEELRDHGVGQALCHGQGLRRHGQGAAARSIALRGYSALACSALSLGLVATPAAHKPHGSVDAANILYWYGVLPLFGVRQRIPREPKGVLDPLRSILASAAGVMMR